MKDIFMFSFNAVMPILLMMMLGYFLRSVHFADEAFFKKANTLVFKVFLPVLLFVNVYEIESLSKINWAVVVYTVAIVGVLSSTSQETNTVTQDKMINEIKNKSIVFFIFSLPFVKR